MRSEPLQTSTNVRSFLHTSPQERPELIPLLLGAKDLARLLCISLATLWRLKAAGKLPRPLASGFLNFSSFAKLRLARR
jgi:hypothetical protein